MAAQRADAVSFIGLIIAYGWFIVAEFGAGLQIDGMIGRVLSFYVAAAVGMTLLQILAAWAFGKTAPQDRQAERDIDRRSRGVAYIAMMSVMWAVPFLLALPYGVPLTLVACVGVMGLAEVVRYGSRLVYRGLGQRAWAASGISAL